MGKREPPSLFALEFEEVVRHAFFNIQSHLPWGHLLRGRVEGTESKQLVIWAHIPAKALQNCHKMAQYNLLSEIFGLQLSSSRYDKWISMCRIHHLEFQTSCQENCGVFPVTIYLQISCGKEKTKSRDPMFRADFSELCCQLECPTSLEQGTLKAHILLRRLTCVVKQEWDGEVSFARFLRTAKLDLKKLVEQARKTQATRLLAWLPRVLVVIVDQYVW